MMTFIVVVCVLLALLTWAIIRAYNQYQLRRHFVRQYRFPVAVFASVLKAYPHLTPADAERVGLGLRQFFLVFIENGYKFVAMPSKVVDVAWHQFLMDKVAYDNFCQKAFGRYLQHIPAAILSSVYESNVGLRSSWRCACNLEKIRYSEQKYLPLLFSLDSVLKIPDGYYYAPDCFDVSRHPMAKDFSTEIIHCCADFESRRFDGTIDGLLTKDEEEDDEN
jgi:hypothetical protein